MKKLLLVLPANSPWARIIRRGAVMFLFGGLSVALHDFITNQGSYISEIWIPILTAILSMIDKMMREFKEGK